MKKFHQSLRCYQVWEPEHYIFKFWTFPPHLVQFCLLWAQEHQYFYYISWVTVEPWNHSGLTQKFIYHSCKPSQGLRQPCSLFNEGSRLCHLWEVASKEVISRSQPTIGMSREDNGGSYGPGLEVATVTSTDVSLAKGWSCGHIRLQRRQGKVVDLSTWAWWTASLVLVFLVQLLPAGFWTIVTGLSSSTFSQALNQWGSQRVIPLQSSYLLYTHQNCKEVLEVVYYLTLPPHFSSSSTSFGCSLRLNNLKSLTLDFHIVQVTLYSQLSPERTLALPSVNAFPVHSGQRFLWELTQRKERKDIGRVCIQCCYLMCFRSALPQLRASSFLSNFLIMNS